MTTVLATLVVGLLTLLAQGMGGGLLRLVGGRGIRASPVTALLAGLVVIHWALTGLQALGAAWTRWSLVLVLGIIWLLIVLTTRRFAARRAHPEPEPGQGRLGWGEALAGLALAGFASAAWTLRSVNPDFIFHWGLKAKKLVLAGGLDFAYLGHPWNHYTHPDYPTLLPELYAASALIAGDFAEPALLTWSVIFFAALLWTARDWLGRRVSRGARQAGLAILALAVAAYAIGHLQAGGADLMIAVALLAGAHALGSDVSTARTDLELGTAAAFAAASKIEGVVLAAILVGSGLVRAGLRRELSMARGLRLLLPPLGVIVPWIVLSSHHGLFQETNLGAFDASRIEAIVGALAASMALPAWHGLPYLLGLLPFLVVFRRTRWLAVAALLQLAFYLYVYATTPVDPVFYVRSSFPRLLLHVVPAVILGGVAVLAGSRAARKR